MKKRVTVMLDNNNVKKLRTIQVKKIKKSSASVSFSSVIDEILHQEFD